MQQENGTNFHMRFRTSSSLRDCHEAHPGETYMLKKILHAHNDPDKLDKVLIFENKRLLRSVVDVYGPYTELCKIYPYDLRYKHGNYALSKSSLKKKERDPIFSDHCIKQEEHSVYVKIES